MITTRRITTILVAGAVALTGTFITAGGAMATKGNCNPAPASFNEQTQVKGNGAILVEARYGWDGVSVFPDCDGPLIRVRVTNTTQNQTWYAVFPRPRRPQAPPIVITFAPGFQQIYSPAQLSAVGLDTINDLSDYDLTQTNPNG